MLIFPLISYINQICKNDTKKHFGTYSAIIFSWTLIIYLPVHFLSARGPWVDRTEQPAWKHTRPKRTEPKKSIGLTRLLKLGSWKWNDLDAVLPLFNNTYFRFGFSWFQGYFFMLDDLYYSCPLQILFFPDVYPG